MKTFVGVLATTVLSADAVGVKVNLATQVGKTPEQQASLNCARGISEWSSLGPALCVDYELNPDKDVCDRVHYKENGDLAWTAAQGQAGKAWKTCNYRGSLGIDTYRHDFHFNGTNWEYQPQPWTGALAKRVCGDPIPCCAHYECYKKYNGDTTYDNDSSDDRYDHEDSDSGDY